jgi:hypothetical protein
LARPSRARRTLPYSGRRRRSAISPRVTAAKPAAVADNEDMIFDQPPAELPVATLVPRDGKTRMRADFYAWVAAKWNWFKPRTVPMLVAAAGMFAVIGSANWLRNYARRAPERLVATQQPVNDALVIGELPDPEPAKIVIEVGPPNAVITLDGKAVDKLPTVELTPGCASSTKLAK